MTYIITKIKNTLSDDIKKLFGTIYPLSQKVLYRNNLI